MPRQAVTSRSLKSVARQAFQIEGVDELKKKLAEILDKTTGEEIKEVYLRAAMRLRDEARAGAPVRKGLLKSAIFVARGKPSAPNVLFGVNHKIAPHSHWIEFGNVRHPAHPYFRPAITAARPVVAATIIQGFQDVIAKATK